MEDSLLSSCSVSFAPVLPEPEATPSSSSNQTSDLVAPQPVEGGPTSAETRSNDEAKEEEKVGEGGSKDVNLLTLTFGMHEEEEEEEDKSHEESSSALEDITPNLPAPTWSRAEAESETVSCSVEEEEEEEEDDDDDDDSGYISHPCIRDLKSLM